MKRTCPHINQKGRRRWLQCGLHAKHKAKNGKYYCSSHILHPHVPEMESDSEEEEEDEVKGTIQFDMNGKLPKFKSITLTFDNGETMELS